MIIIQMKEKCWSFHEQCVNINAICSAHFPFILRETYSSDEVYRVPGCSKSGVFLI